jgi:CheY-like chemotaxis protein
MSKRILVVEDQPDNRQIIRDMLAPTDYECVFADINADHGNCAVEALGHGVLLCLWRPLPDSSLAGQEHGRTIPLADIRIAKC